MQSAYFLSSERKEGVARLEFAGFISIKISEADMINNTSLEKFDRLSQKKLDSQFVNEIKQGLQCSPFEANAILDSVYKIYAPYFRNNGAIKPGQTLFQVLAIDNPPSVDLSESNQITVTLTVDDPDEDLEIRKNYGIISLRQHRLQRVCNEAYQQGGILTVEDLAYRLFNCGERTICRDLESLRNRNIVLPLRSTIKDMGRTISHRSLVVKLWLRGKEYSDIAKESFHSVHSVKNYVDKFKRVIMLSEEAYDVNTIAFLVKISPSLVEEYFKIYKAANIASHRQKELDYSLKKNSTHKQQGGEAIDT